MTTHIGVGFSREPNTTTAARDASLQAKTNIKTATDLAIVFGTAHYSPLETLRVVRQTLGDAKVIGCSTAGIIREAIETRGIAVLAIKSNDMKFGAGYVSDLTPSEMRIAGAKLARDAVADFGQSRRGAFLILYDGLLKNHSLLLKGIQEVFGRVFPIIGAGSSDNFRFKETYQFFQDKPLNHSVVAVLLGGQMTAGFAAYHGWKPLGKPRQITKADGHIIKTIDNKKASLLYEEYLGMSSTELKTEEGIQSCYFYPLGTALEGEKEYLLRHIIGILDDGSLLCQGEISEGAEIHMMITNKDFLRQAAVDAAYEVKNTLYGREPQCIIIFESLARQHLLGREAIEEIRAIREILGMNVPVVGMYSYGIINPLKSLNFKGESYLHNGSILILAVT